MYIVFIFLCYLKFDFDRKDCFPPTVKLVFLGTKGQGRSTLLSYLKLTKLSPASSCASNQSLFYLDLDAKPQIASMCV